MIPCLKNKCILLPVCKGKGAICCDELREWMEDAPHPWIDISDTLGEVFQILPYSTDGLQTLRIKMRYNSCL